MIIVYTTERDYPWGSLRSTNASKVKVVLEEKGLPYRVERMKPGDLWKKPPEFLAKHPLGKVPYIEDGQRLIYDSTVINEYLDETYPEPPLMPRDLEKMEKGRMGLRKRALPYLEKSLTAQDYLCGDFSLADVGFMPMAMVLQVDGFDLTPYPRTQAYFERLKGRPSYRTIDPRTSLEDSAGRCDNASSSAS